MNTLKRFRTTKALLAGMIALQTFWLVMRWAQVPALDWGQFPPAFTFALVAGLAIWIIPDHLALRFERLIDSIIQTPKYSIFAICMIVLLTGFIYSAFKPAIGDENPNFDASRIVAEEGLSPFFSEYGSIPWLGDRHPPLAPLLYGFGMRLLGVNLTSMRLISIVLGVMVAVTTYFLGKALYDCRTGLLAGLFLATLPAFLNKGSVHAETEILVTLWFTLAMLLAWHLNREPTYRLAVLLGGVIGMGLLSKYTMVLIYLALLSYFALYGSWKRLWPYLGTVALLSAGILTAWLAYAVYLDVFGSQVERLSGFAGVGRGENGRLNLLANWRMRRRLGALTVEVPTGLGAYSIPVFLLAGLEMLRQRNESDVYLLVWIGAIFVPMFLTLPTVPYFVPAFPALAIVAARGVQRIPKATGKAILLTLFYSAQVLYVYVLLAA